MTSTATAGAAAVSAPTSEAEAVAAVTQQPNATVLAGGTLLVPQHNLGHAEIERVVWLGRAGMSAIVRSNGSITVGAATPLAKCAGLPAPAGPCAARIGDNEVNAQATIGGNVCSPAPYGDMRGPLLALGAQLHWADADGKHTGGVTDFVAAGGSRPGVLLLDVAFAVPAAGSFVALRRHHTQSLCALAVSAVRGGDGAVAIAATGAAPDACRLHAAEAVLAGGGAIAEAAAAAAADADPYDDALASAAYRRRVLPVYVARALEQIGE
ncbi:MAG: FAD binding domain-containing protein [Acidimicrobiaceae bacterium]|nr:FAD binding domain-containing protein [Acidimicrobiaceae bacterium]